MSGFLTKAKNAYINIRGFHTNRKLVVLESDDWGSIRMPSKETFERLKSLGDNPDADGFLSNDCLESESDLEALYKVLGSVTDGAGKTPVLTANFAVANPNFDKINLEEGTYEYEPFYETYKKYYGENRVLDIIKDGYSRGLLEALEVLGDMVYPLISRKQYGNTGYNNYNNYNSANTTKSQFNSSIDNTLNKMRKSY